MFEQRILIGVNGRPQGLDAVAFGAALARVTGAGLLLVHVYEPSAKWTAGEREVQWHLRDHNERVLDAALAEVPDDVQAQRAVVGSVLPAPALVGLAHDEGCDSIVVGSTHKHLAGRVLAGSTGELLLSGAGMPVAVAPPGYAGRPTGPFLRVDAAFDASPEADAALAGAARLARLADAHLRVVAVADPGVLKKDAMRLERELRDRAGESLARLAVRAEVDVRRGDAAATLLETCADSDVVFAGARAHGPLRDELPGVVSAKLIRSCDAPVVVVSASHADGPAENPALTGSAP